MDSDDELTLSSSAMDALKAFYAERDENARRFAELNAAATAAAAAAAAAGAEADKPALIEPLATLEVPLSMKLFTEDWNASQFWYSDDTANLLARQLMAGAGPETLIAVVSTPSVFVALKNAMVSMPDAEKPKLLLLEYDHRFAVFPEFVHYDFNAPTKLPASLRGTADRIMVDPPFLSEDCQTKTALTARWLARSVTKPVILSTGERMAPLIIEKLYKAQGLRPTDYVPEHAHGLSNEFYCYANFESPDWKFLAD
ncbi:n-6 adenine-specific dna methyltransferase 2 [Ophiostoma piceae UAMH 11346]|uniref:Protein-lysine N-methyltransferase EFM5 n=1 Tax=Ophiostoma piceae (strain UAMH 11346) TaxID=1262450 RepID=S3CAY1_OPHP1|nr:n-6 adenine-specific dna methyltransferase 2 [Ophiostoma piceae UAMH 11346]